MASLSAATRKNSAQQNSINPPVVSKETNKNVINVECGINSSLKKSYVNKSLGDTDKRIGTLEEADEVGEENQTKLFNERSDSGISDCSSVGSNHGCQCNSANAPLLNKKYSITEQEEESKCHENKFESNNINAEPSAEISKKEIETKVDVIRKKFANLSKNIDEMDKKLETVGKKLDDITSGKIKTEKRPEIKRVPSLKEHRSHESRKSSLMRPTASSQAKVTIPLKQPIDSPRLISTITIPESSDHKTSKPSKNSLAPFDEESNPHSVSFSTATNKLAATVKTSLSAGNSSSHLKKAQPSPKIQSLREIYNCKTTSLVKSSNEKSKNENFSDEKKSHDINEKFSSIRGMRSLNFQETVAFWKR